MAIVRETGNHVPMHVRRPVPQARDVHLVGPHRRAHRGFHRPDHFHQPAALGRFEVGHLPRMALEDHPHETRVVGLVRTHHAAKGILPNYCAPGRGAEFAAGAQKTKRSTGRDTVMPSIVVVKVAWLGSWKSSVTEPTSASDTPAALNGTPTHGTPLAR